MPDSSWITYYVNVYTSGGTKKPELSGHFTTKAQADKHVKALRARGLLLGRTYEVVKQDNTPAKQNPSTIKVKPQADGTVKITMKKLGPEHFNVYLGGTRVGTFFDKASAEKYGKGLLTSRRLFVKGRERNPNYKVAIIQSKGRGTKITNTRKVVTINAKSANDAVAKAYKRPRVMNAVVLS